MMKLRPGEQKFYIMLVCLILNRFTWKFGSGLICCCVVWLLSFANIFDMSLWFQKIVILIVFSKFITNITNYYYTLYLLHEWFFCCSFFLYTNGSYLKWGLWNLEFHHIKKECNDYIIKKIVMKCIFNEFKNLQYLWFMTTDVLKVILKAHIGIETFFYFNIVSLLNTIF